MRTRSRRGSVLVHVLVTSIIVMILAAGMARMLMMRYAAEHRVEDGGARRRLADSAIAQAQAAWSSTNPPTNCTPTVPGLTTDSASQGTCSCQYHLDDATTQTKVTLTSSLSGSTCNLIVTVDGLPGNPD